MSGIHLAAERHVQIFRELAEIRREVRGFAMSMDMPRAKRYIDIAESIGETQRLVLSQVSAAGFLNGLVQYETR